MFKKLSTLFLALVLTFSLSACSQEASELAGALAEVAIEEALNYAEDALRESAASSDAGSSSVTEDAPAIDASGSYTTKEDVALYIHTYGCLPENFITKEEARALGWDGKNLDSYAPGMCIGGNTFGNREGLLPSKKGRTYTECDIDTLGAKARGIKRIVFSNDGLIYYTDDHYESFTLLYGDESQ